MRRRSGRVTSILRCRRCVSRRSSLATDSADDRRLALPIAAPRVFISRQVMFYASSIVFLALYFGLTAVGGLLRARRWARSAAAAADAGHRHGRPRAHRVSARGMAACAACAFSSRSISTATSTTTASTWLRFVQTLSSGVELDVPPQCHPRRRRNLRQHERPAHDSRSGHGALLSAGGVAGEEHGFPQVPVDRAGSRPAAAARGSPVGRSICANTSRIRSGTETWSCRSGWIRRVPGA